MCPPHLYTVPNLPWEIQKKSFFNSIIHTLLQIIYVIAEENKLLPSYPPHLKNVTALPCKMHKFFIFFIFHAYQVPICYMDELRKRLVATWLNFSRACWTMQLISGKNIGSMYPCRRWSLWTFAVTLLAWHSICHISQPVLFRATNANPQQAFIRANNVWKNATYLQSDEKLVHFTR